MKFKPEDLPLLDTYDWVDGEMVEVKKRPRAWLGNDDYGNRDWSPREDGNTLYVSGEEGDGFVDYYPDWSPDPYIHPVLKKWAEKRGYYWDWMNAGVIVLVEN
jgi:hypothetical protein